MHGVIKSSPNWRKPRKGFLGKCDKKEETPIEKVWYTMIQLNAKYLLEFLFLWMQNR